MLGHKEIKLKLISIKLVLYISTILVSPQYVYAESNNSTKIRFDGGYFIKEKYNYHRGYRFFEDGSVTGATVVRHPKNDLDSFKKNDRLQNNGKYFLKGNKLKINMVFSSLLKREYLGSVNNDTVTLSWINPKDNKTITEEFEFIKMYSKGKGKQSLWSDKKNCKDEGASIISIISFNNSYKILACVKYGCRIAVPGFGKREQPYNYKLDPRLNWINDTEFELKIKNKMIHFYSCNLK